LRKHPAAFPQRGNAAGRLKVPAGQQAFRESLLQPPPARKGKPDLIKRNPFMAEEKRICNLFPGIQLRILKVYYSLEFVIDHSSPLPIVAVLSALRVERRVAQFSALYLTERTAP
jgi:hypothetical protein